MPLRVAFLTTHPIQYQVPVFRHLARDPDLDFKVLYCVLPDDKQQGDGFGVAFRWDLPLLEGYEYEVLKNVSPAPGVTSFRGCDTPDIGEVIRRHRLDALVINGWVVKSCLQGLRACRKLGIPCLVRGEANLLRPRAWWKGLLHRRLLRGYAACLYIGEANRRFYQHNGVPDARLFPARYCIENERFAAQAAEWEGREHELRARFGVPEDDCCFLYGGKFVEKKHPVELLGAFERTAAGGARAHLLMVGDGELRGRCEEFVRERKLPVTFAGFLNQTRMAEAYLAADCLVLPSDHGETWGLVVNEAMACGRPAVVSWEVGCAEDLIEEGVTGGGFDAGDWDGLAERLAEFAGRRGKLKEMGAAARERVADYSPAAAARGIASAVRHVVAGAGAGAAVEHV